MLWESKTQLCLHITFSWKMLGLTRSSSHQFSFLVGISTRLLSLGCVPTERDSRASLYFVAYCRLVFIGCSLGTVSQKIESIYAKG